MKLRPLDDKIIIKPTSEEEKTSSGIVLPETADKEKPEQGEVVSVGPGKIGENGKRLPMNVKKGDKVLFKKYSPDEIKIGEEEYLVAKEEDILAIIE